jgi:AcrR family transcriptional regulator
MDAVKKEKRPPGRPPAFSTEEALDGAMYAFWKHGYDGVDLEQIAASLGATKPSLYRHFGCKKTLFVASMNHYAAKVVVNVEQMLAQGETIHESLRHLITTLFENYTRPDMPRGCFLGCSATALTEDHPEAGEIFLQTTAMLEAAIVCRLTVAVQAGELPSTFDARKRGRLLTDILNGNTLRARVGAPRANLMEMVEEILRAVLE